MQRFFGLLLMLAAAIGAYFAIQSVLWQHKANRAFEPVPARVFSTEIRVHRRSKGGNTYSPEATYSYTYQGRPFESNRVLAVSYNSSNRSWAEGVLARIGGTQVARGPEGWNATAYVDPADPKESILVRDYTFLPYALGTGALFASMFGAGLLSGVVAAGRSKMAAVALDDSGWQLLLPVRPLRRQFWNSVFWLIGGGSALLVMPLHWTFIARQTSLFGTIASAVALVIVAALAITTFRRWSISRHMSDARLSLRPAPMRRGEVLAMQFGADAHSLLRVRKAAAHVECTEHYREQRGNKTVHGTRTRTKQTVELCGPTQVAAGAELTGKGEVFFEQNAHPPTTDITIKQYPYYTWEIRLVVELEGMVDYAATFPLEVD